MCFPAQEALKGDRPMSDNAILVAMRTMGIGKEVMSGHGFRAMARTILDEVLGFRPDFIEHQLAHRVRDPNGRAYNRTAHLAWTTQDDASMGRLSGRTKRSSMTIRIVFMTKRIEFQKI